MNRPCQHYENPAGFVSRAWGRAPVPVYVRGTRGHDWFYRKNRNPLPLSYGEVWAGVTYTVPRRAILNAPPPMRPLFDFCHVMSFGLTNVPLQPHHALVT